MQTYYKTGFKDCFVQGNDWPIHEQKQMLLHSVFHSHLSPPASLVCLAPHFRLLRSCEESQHNGSLQGIDALLGESC